MFGHHPSKSRLATLLHFAPPPDHFPVVTRILAAVGLVAVGTLVGLKLSPLFRSLSEPATVKPRATAPVVEIDRWANEGGAVAQPVVGRPI